MLIELIEKKNKPVMTRFKFSKREYEMLPLKNKVEYSEKYQIRKTARTVYFDVEGDWLNFKKGEENDKRKDD